MRSLFALLLVPLLSATSCGRGTGVALAPDPGAGLDATLASRAFALRFAGQFGLTARQDSVEDVVRWDTCASRPDVPTFSLCWRTRPDATVEFRLLEWRRGGGWPAEALRRALPDSLRAAFGAARVLPCIWVTGIDRERSTAWRRETQTACVPRAAEPSAP